MPNSKWVAQKGFRIDISTPFYHSTRLPYKEDSIFNFMIMFFHYNKIVDDALQ